MTTKRELRADKVTVLAGLVANPEFLKVDFERRYELYAEIMELVNDVHEDHDDEVIEPTPRTVFDWDVAMKAVIETGESLRRDYPAKNTAQTTTSKLKKKYKDLPVRIMASESETGGGTIIVTKRLR